MVEPGWLQGQHPVVGDAEDGNEERENGRVDEGETGAQRQRRHVDLSVSIYPTPRTVWISDGVKPRSTLFLSELMWTSTTLLTLSK